MIKQLTYPSRDLVNQSKQLTYPSQDLQQPGLSRIQVGCRTQVEFRHSFVYFVELLPPNILQNAGQDLFKNYMGKD